MKNVKVLCSVLILLVGSASLKANEVREWNTAILDLIKADAISNHSGNRATAMLHVAMFDAINGIQGQYEPFTSGAQAPQDLPEQAAVASAAYEILSVLYPQKMDRFQPVYDEQLARVPEGPGKQAAIDYGRLVAQDVLASRENDGSAQAAGVPYPDGTEPGQWRRIGEMPPMLPGWGQVRPFAMIRGDQFRLLGPLDMTGYEYARDYAEVMEMGAKNSASRTEEQTATARFWISGIPRIWNLVAQQVSDAKGYTLLEDARLFALLNVALADAQVVGWDMKYHYGFWRPVTAIRNGDQDDNEGTMADGAWESLLPAPAFPEYPSGHTTSCSAAATVLAKFTGTDAFTFVLSSEANPSLPQRTYPDFADSRGQTCVAGSKMAFSAESLHYMAASFGPVAAVIRGGGWAGSCSFSRAKSSCRSGCGWV